jgi:hypothetical protein
MASTSTKRKRLKLPEELDLALLTHYHSTGDQRYAAALDIAAKNELFTRSSSVADTCSALFKAMFDKDEIPFTPVEKGKESFTFVDLFAGIGGFRMALRMWAVVVCSHQNGINTPNKLTLQIMVITLLVTLPKTQLKPIYQKSLI